MEIVVVNRSFWRGRRVLVTGHTGFKGGWLSLWLQALGSEVSGLALPPPTTPSLFDAARVGEAMRSEIVDLRDAPKVAAAVRAAAPEIVLHLAAQPLVRASYADPVETYATNVMGTVHLLEAVRRTPSVRAVVVVSSDKCYDNREWLWAYREIDPVGGFDPYSSSKGCVELVTAAYRSSYFSAQAPGAQGAGVATARAGNVIGGGDWAADRLVPDCIRALEAKVPVRIRYPDAVRPWQHVLDPLAGYLMLAERLHGGDRDCAGAWNFGPSEEDARPVRHVVEELVKRWDAQAAWETEALPQPHEAHYLKLDCSKAHALLGWRRRWPLQVALEQTSAWYRGYHVHGDMREHTLAQISAFEYGHE